MARRRMIEVSIAHDKILNSLSDFAQLLYLKILPHTDDFGRFEGDPETVKARVEPLSKRKISVYERAMTEISTAKLWMWYETDKERKIVQYNPESFERINAFLIKNRGNSEYPPYKKEYKLISIDMPAYHIKSNKYKEESKKIKDKDIIEFKDGKLIIPNNILEEFYSVFGRKNVDCQFPAMEKWLKFNKPKKDFKRFVFNWLNKPQIQNATIETPRRKKEKCPHCGLMVDSALTHELECPKAPKPADPETVKKYTQQIKDLTNNMTTK